jgi:hypothetical protein
MSIVDEFETEFWPNVPKGHKLGKGAARKAYIKARRVATKDEILAGLAGYRQYEIERHRRSTGHFQPLHPSTWLNQERWTDDIPINEPKTLAETMPPCACGCGRQALKSNYYDGKYWATMRCWWKTQQQ